jgi:hypothetical protein
MCLSKLLILKSLCSNIYKQTYSLALSGAEWGRLQARPNRYNKTTKQIKDVSRSELNHDFGFIVHIKVRNTTKIFLTRRCMGPFGPSARLRAGSCSGQVYTVYALN